MARAVGLSVRVIRRPDALAEVAPAAALADHTDVPHADGQLALALLLQELGQFVDELREDLADEGWFLIHAGTVASRARAWRPIMRGTRGVDVFRTSLSIAGTWTPLADTEANPFARSTNVTFDGTPWTQDISHGEMLRDGVDQTLTIDPCRLRYLYQGMDPAASGPYNTLPWRLGLLTQTNSPC